MYKQRFAIKLIYIGNKNNRRVFVCSRKYLNSGVNANIPSTHVSPYLTSIAVIYRQTNCTLFISKYISLFLQQIVFAEDLAFEFE